MATAAKRAPRELRELSPTERERLQQAQVHLQDAVERYEELVDAPEVAALRSELSAAQDTVRRAEDELWQLREELLDWARPSWAPNATFVADWFSDEDRIYDNLP